MINSEEQVKSMNDILATMDCEKEVGKDKQTYLELIQTIATFYKKELMQAPAAKVFHCNYRGGLLEHTINVMKFVQEICKPEERNEMIYLAFIHDLGKIKCYKFGKNYKGNECVEYDDTIDHTYWTIHLLAKIKIVLADDQLNVISFHHGGWSPKHDYIKMNRKAILLHCADMLAVNHEEKVNG